MKKLALLLVVLSLVGCSDIQHEGNLHNDIPLQDIQSNISVPTDGLDESDMIKTETTEMIESTETVEIVQPQRLLILMKMEIS